MEKLLEVLKPFVVEGKLNDLKTVLTTQKVIIDDGTNNIPQSRLNEVILQREQFKKQFEQLSTEMEKLKDLDKKNETLSSEINRIKKEQEDLKKIHETELVKTKKIHKIELELIPLVHDVKSAMVHIDQEKIIVKDDSITGLKEQIDYLKEHKKFLLKENVPGNNHGGDNGNPPFERNGFVNPFNPKTLNYAEQSKLKKSNPTLYTQLELNAQKGIY